MAHTKTLQQKPKPHRIALARIRYGLREVAEGLLVAAVIMLVVQVLYPRSMTLPNTYIGGAPYGWRSTASVAASLTDRNQQEIEIHSGEHVWKHKLADMGLSIDATKDSQAVSAYSWKERLVPFSLLFTERNIEHYSLEIDEAKANTFAQTLVKFNKAPANARVELKGTEVMVHKSVFGYAYQPSEVVEALKQSKLTHSMKLSLTPGVEEPDISDQTASEAALILRQRLQQPLTIEVAGISTTLQANALAKWLTIKPEANNKLKVTYDRAKVQRSLERLAPKVYIVATPRTVNSLDGVATGIREGKAGRMLDMAKSIDSVITAASANKTTIHAHTQAVQPATIANRRYTRTDRGLQALVTYWGQNTGGQWGIVLRDFRGTITASHNGGTQFISASVYKIYVAYIVYSKVEAGQLKMSQKTHTGKTVAQCLELAIVRSDNICADALGDLIGWGKNNSALHAKGFGSTYITWGGQLTTAEDAADYLTLLETGGLLSAGHRADLLSKLGRGIYRYAIPAGSPGMHVANKLGATGAYNHDVAIVYHPKGSYVLSVFSYGSNHAQIRSLAREIANVMSQ